MDYPEPPKSYSTEYDEIHKVEVKLFSLGQMQAYLDADRAQRTAPVGDAQPVVDTLSFLELARMYCAVTETPSGDLEWSFRQRDMESLAAEIIAAQPVEVQRVGLTDEQRRRLIGNYFAEKWAQEAAYGLLDDAESHYGIKPAGEKGGES